MKPKLLDLFCGAGGAAVGYARAGFEVEGVDIKPQPMVEYMYGKIRRYTMLRLRENAPCANTEGAANQSSMPPLRSETSRYCQAELMGKPGTPSPVAWWNSYRRKWLSEYCSPFGQSVVSNGRREGTSI